MVNCNAVQSLVSIVKAMQLLSIQYASETVAKEAWIFMNMVKGKYHSQDLRLRIRINVLNFSKRPLILHSM